MLMKTPYENQRRAKDRKKKRVRLVTRVLKNRSGSQEAFSKRTNVSITFEKGTKTIVMGNARDA